METLNIAKEFTTIPGARNYSDGKHSGEEFFNELLRDKFDKAVASGTPLQIIMDGTEGYPSSFINEAFRLLREHIGSPDKVWDNLLIVSKEIPKYKIKVKAALYEK